MSLVIFLVTWVQRLPEAAEVQIPSPQIPSLMPWQSATVPFYRFIFTLGMLQFGTHSGVGLYNKNNNILCSIDLSDVIAPLTPLLESHHRSLWSLQISITLTKGALFFFCNPGLKKCLHGWGLNVQP